MLRAASCGETADVTLSEAGVVGSCMITIAIADDYSILGKVSKFDSLKGLAFVERTKSSEITQHLG